MQSRQRFSMRNIELVFENENNNKYYLKFDKWVMQGTSSTTAIFVKIEHTFWIAIKMGQHSFFIILFNKYVWPVILYPYTCRRHFWEIFSVKINYYLLYFNAKSVEYTILLYWYKTFHNKMRALSWSLITEALAPLNSQAMNSRGLSMCYVTLLKGVARY